MVVLPRRFSIHRLIELTLSSCDQRSCRDVCVSAGSLQGVIVLRVCIVSFTAAFDRYKVSDSVRSVGLLGQLLYHVSKALLNFATSRRYRSRFLLFNSANPGIYLRIGLCDRSFFIFLN